MTRINPDPNFPNRPQHPDFWVLSEIVCALDDEASEKDLPELMTIDIDSVMYMAEQRVRRAAVNSAAQATLQTVMMSIWLDAFAAGARWGQRL